MSPLPLPSSPHRPSFYVLHQADLVKMHGVARCRGRRRCCCKPRMRTYVYGRGYPRERASPPLGPANIERSLFRLSHTTTRTPPPVLSATATRIIPPLHPHRPQVNAWKMYGNFLFLIRPPPIFFRRAPPPPAPRSPPAPPSFVHFRARLCVMQRERTHARSPAYTDTSPAFYAELRFFLFPSPRSLPIISLDNLQSYWSGWQHLDWKCTMALMFFPARYSQSEEFLVKLNESRMNILFKALLFSASEWTTSFTKKML